MSSQIVPVKDLPKEYARYLPANYRKHNCSIDRITVPAKARVDSYNL